MNTSRINSNRIENIALRIESNSNMKFEMTGRIESNRM